MNKWLVVAILFAASSATALAAAPVAAESASAAKANLDLGIAYLQKGNLAAAKEKLERARQQAPRNTAIRSAVAFMYARMGETSRADGEFREALRMVPKDPELMNNYAVFLCGHERNAEGVVLFQQAAASPTYSTPWAASTNAGVCLRNAKRYPEAEIQFNKALAIKPAHAEAIYQLADMDLAQKNTAAAYQRVAKFVAGNIPTPELLYLGWRAATELQDKVNALKLARRLQVEFPNSEQTKVLLAGGNGGKSG
jgi:type IV pilus assembly protein PilF